MKQIKLFLYCFLLTPLVCMAQESNFSKDIKDYLEHNGTMRQYEYAYDQLMIMMEGNYPKSEDNKQGWTYLEENRGKALEEMKSLMVPIYQENFTHEEIKQMGAFYKTEAGVLLITDRSKMTDIHKEELNTFYNSVVGQKIISKKEVLISEISKVSESWSRQLYETSLRLLQNG
ncbi:DUF2059 domain-containing protein [Maribacter arenosus]|uniref:DUF2059 domain-containing protein n=1 Tax=Maribacter arenosus TaxID=1854708 RepID=A0ABR7VD16_9FLAO|nr:DUF2059 domain-containing protein [Maribacter arenosus]MBD0850740.1 DUF2059 domain-containing protein [Maribacter arenosus]